MNFIRFYFEAYILIFIFYINYTKSQFNNQNATTFPYPYQRALGLPPGQGIGLPNPQNMGIPYPSGPMPYPYAGNNVSPTGIFNSTQSLSHYYALLAQQGIPAYQYAYGMGYPQPGIGYSQPAYPSFGVRYPPTGGYGYPYPGIRYQQPGFGSPYYPQQDPYNYVGSPYDNTKAEIIDVDPEYHRRAMGWPSENTPAGRRTGEVTNTGSNQINQASVPRYTVKTDSQTTNFTSIPSNLSNPVITTKKFTTSIRRTFVYDSSKPGENKPVNIHIINGQQVTTTPPPTTTENEDVADRTVTPRGRRFMDVPASCPKGTELAHNGECIQPFLLAKLAKKQNITGETLTYAPTVNENDI